MSLDDATTLLYLATKLEESLHLLTYYSDNNDLSHLAEQKKAFLELHKQIESFVRLKTT